MTSDLLETDTCSYHWGSPTCKHLSKAFQRRGGHDPLGQHLGPSNPTESQTLLVRSQKLSCLSLAANVRCMQVHVQKAW